MVQPQRHDLFDLIRTSWKQGRQIVPLLGAGISIGAGIPLVADIEDYLLKLILLFQSGGGERTEKRPIGWIPERLLRYGWPRRHQLNLDAQLFIERYQLDLQSELHRCRREAYRHAIEFELRNIRPSLALAYRHLRSAAADSPSPSVQALGSHNDWRALLALTTENDQALKDAFFDRLVRDRRPATTHQFIAYLTKLLNCGLLFTTNFDDLVETALRDEDLRPVVYEITTTSNPPAPQLVWNHLSIVKLHGGAFGLRAGSDLDEALDERALAAFRSYVSEDALLLVLGYGGSDRRVMSLIEAMARPAAGRDECPRVLWLLCGEEPASLKQLKSLYPASSAVEVHPVGDARLFLQELYYRLTHVHPATRSAYLALHHLPPPEMRAAEVRSGDTSGGDGQADGTSSVVFRSQSASHAASMAMSAHVRRLQRQRYQPLWVDLHQITSVGSLVALLVDQLTRTDRWLLPLSAPIAAEGRWIAGPFPRSQGDDQSAPLDPNATDPFDGALDWLVNALKRGRYVLALDGLSQFGILHPSDPLKVIADTYPEVRAELIGAQRDMLDFIWLLLKRSDRFGESRVCVTLVRPADDVNPHWRNRMLEHPLWRFAPSSFVEVREMPPGSDPSRDDGRDWLIQACGNVETIASRERARLLLCVIASAFRRPRTIVGLARVVGSLVRLPESALDGRPTSLATCLAALRDEVYDAPRNRIRQMPLQRLVEDCQSLTIRSSSGQQALLSRQEGGLYWMRRTVRDGVYLAAHDLAPRLMVSIHDAIARYYLDQLYQQSREPQAFFEYAFHRFVSSSSLTYEDPTRQQLLRWLTTALSREREHLLARGRLATLQTSLGRILTTVTFASLRRAGRPLPMELDLRLLVDDIIAECYRDAGRFNESAQRLDRQLQTLEERERLDGAKQPDATARRRELELDRRNTTLMGWDPLDDPPEVAPTVVDDLKRIEAELRTEMDEPAKPYRERNAAVRLIVKSTILRMKGALRQLEGAAEPRSDAERAAIEAHRSEAIACHDEVDNLLRWYSGSHRGARYRCYLRCLRARAEYLQRSTLKPAFGDAYAWLNEAQGSISRAALPADRTALAVAHLFLAELSIENAQFKLVEVLQATHQAIIIDLNDLLAAKDDPEDPQKNLTQFQLGAVRKVLAKLERGATDAFPEPLNTPRCAVNMAAELENARDVGTEHLAPSRKRLTLERVIARLETRLSLAAARRTSELLMRGSVALMQAEAHLQEGIRSGEWWAFLFRLRARFAFSLLNLEQHMRNDRDWNRNSSVNQRETLLDALSAIRASLDNNPRDQMRRRELHVLWLQLRECHHSHPPEGRKTMVEQDWRAANERAGLDSRRLTTPNRSRRPPHVKPSA